MYKWSMGGKQTSKKERLEQMVSHLSQNLEHYNQYKFEKRDFDGTGIVYYLAKDRDAIVLLPKNTYTEEQFRALGNTIKNRGYVFNFLFYKDGVDFFRSAADEEGTGLQGKTFKLKEDGTLKNYSHEDMYRMIQLTKPEIMTREKLKTVHYYQPKSEKLEEGIVSFDFDNVVHDYSHIPASARYGPVTKNSKLIYMWNKDGKKEYFGKIKFKKGLFQEIKEEPQQPVQTNLF